MQKIRSLVVFDVADETMAIDILNIERIINLPEIKKLPSSKSYIEGVIECEGKITLVMNLKKSFNKVDTSIKTESKIIIVNYGGTNLGLIADYVDEIIEVEEDKIQSSFGMLKKVSDEYIDGIVKLGDKMVILMNTKKLIDKSQLE
jgi:purine-binding chemotaxis protein CheW